MAKNELVRYAFSSAITFFSVFLGTLSVLIAGFIDTDVSLITTSSVLGIVITAGRAAVKAVFEDLRGL